MALQGNVNEVIVLDYEKFHALVTVYKRLESKHDVKISLPESPNTLRSSDTAVVGFSGERESIDAAMEFCNSFVFCMSPVPFKYPKELAFVFSNCLWLNLLEELYEVIIANESSTLTVTVSGSSTVEVISALDNLVSSLHDCFQEKHLDEFHKAMAVIQSSSAVSLELKDSLNSAANTLPSNVVLRLLSWLEQYHKKNGNQQLDESVIIMGVIEGNNSANDVILLDTPKKPEPPLLTISDDDEVPDASNNVCKKFKERSKIQAKPRYQLLHSGKRKRRKSKKSKACSSGNKRKVTVPLSVVDNNCEVNKQKIQPLSTTPPRKLRPIVIDGSNIAYAHGILQKAFSWKGIKICIDHFLNRGHTEVVAFVPNYRKRCNDDDRKIIQQLESCQKVVFTPSRNVRPGKSYSSYDDRFIVKFASQNQGVIVSNDNFRDLREENEEWRETIENRLLMYCFVGDYFMIPDDPLGKNGPTLDDFLSFPPDEVSSTSEEDVIVIS